MKETILIVEDTVSDVVFLKQILEKAGYSATYAENGADALAMLDKSVPDLIVLDIVLPDIDGFEVCKRIRANPRFLSLPILFYSATKTVDEKLLGLEMGASDFLPKSADVRELLGRIRNLLKTKQRFDAALSESFHDPVTHTYNLRYFHYRLYHEYLRSKRYDRPFSCAFVEVDNFQAITAGFNVTATDNILRQVGQMMRGSVRSADEVCHYENDVFAVVLPEADVRQAFDAIERVRQAVASSPLNEKKESRKLTVSCGIGCFTPDMKTHEEIIKRALSALSFAKSSGCNQTKFFTEEPGSDILGYGPS